MKYLSFIEDNFMVDDPRTGQLVPFIMRPVQKRYYDFLVRDYDIEKRGIDVPIRECLLKARRQGFSSFFLALFAADALLNPNPTETLVISYRDDATATFRKRYRNFLLSFGARSKGYSVADIQQNSGVLESIAKELLSIDATDLEIKDNHAHFYCGTASARVGGRGGVVQKLLYSEAAWYPDKKEIKASEIIEGTLRQVDIASGWVVAETTANGDNNHYARMWKDAVSGQSRFKPRFFGWQDYYTPEEFELIKSEFTDKRLIPAEYPANPQEAFLSSGNRFFDPTILQSLSTQQGVKQGYWTIFEEYKPGHRYALGCDVSEGVGRHNSTTVIIDFDNISIIEGRTVHKPKVVATYINNQIAPDIFAHEIRSGGNRYGSCLAAVERNNHGFTTLATLKDGYYNIYKDSQDKLGWHTNVASKPKMLHDLRTVLHEGMIDVSDEAIKNELISYPQQDLNVANVDEFDDEGGHFDLTIALAIAWQMRSYAVPSMINTMRDPELQDNDFDKFSAFNQF